MNFCRGKSLTAVMGLCLFIATPAFAKTVTSEIIVCKQSKPDLQSYFNLSMVEENGITTGFVLTMDRVAKDPNTGKTTFVWANVKDLKMPAALAMKIKTYPKNPKDLTPNHFVIPPFHSGFCTKDKPFGIHRGIIEYHLRVPGFDPNAGETDEEKANYSISVIDYSNSLEINSPVEFKNCQIKREIEKPFGDAVGNDIGLPFSLDRNIDKDGVIDFRGVPISMEDKLCPAP